MLLRNIFIVMSFILFSFSAFAQEQNVPSAAETKTEKQDIAEETSQTPKLIKGIIPQIYNSIGDAAAQNIANAEQIFCYQIANRPENFEGYTLNGMAIAGFCGIISQDLQNLIKKEFLSSANNLTFNKTENCVIRPQIMLRFVRGVDSTDLLLSSPCHAIAFFYGGKVSAFNAKPSAEIIDAIIDPLLKNKVEFISPTLLQQLLPIGVPQTDEQKELVKQQNSPLKNWQKQNSNQPKKGGWNKLKSR